MELSAAERDTSKIADWIELQAIYDPSGRVPLEHIRSGLDADGSISDELGGMDDEEFIDLDASQVSELISADVILEIRRRRDILTDAYPFEISEGYLNLVKTRWSPYRFCLLVSDREHFSAGDNLTPKMFEHLVTEATASYVDGEAVRFGAVRDTMAPGVRDAIKELSERLGSRPLGSYPINDTDKDLVTIPKRVA